METLESLTSQNGVFRHPRWKEKERDFLRRHPGCAACGLQASVVAHHIIPVHYLHALARPDLELDDRNLVTLCHSGGGIPCDDHHLYVGHLGDYQSFNLNVLADAAGRFRDIRKSRLWLSVERIHSLLEMLAAYPHLASITDAQLASLKRKVDDLFPRMREH